MMMTSHLASFVVLLSLLLSPSVVGACAAWFCPPAEVHDVGHNGADARTSARAETQATAGGHGHDMSHAHHGAAGGTEVNAEAALANPRVAAEPGPDCCLMAATQSVVAVSTPRSESSVVVLVPQFDSMSAAAIAAAATARASVPPDARIRPPLPVTAARVLRI